MVAIEPLVFTNVHLFEHALFLLQCNYFSFHLYSDLNFQFIWCNLFINRGSHMNFILIVIHS